mmetsp:Transcript_32688/g.66738  ORF Transcript_32688/g.66738 Transcript_32688/m.66738 type:complete len:130 (+) Transcript_32688:135-524(+)
MMILNQSNVDGEDITSEHHTSLPSQSHHHDREELRQELLGKVCFTSSVLQKPAKQPSKKKSSDEASTVVVKEDEGTDDVQHHDTEDAKPQRRCHSKHSQRSKHSKRRAAKWRSHQQRGRIRQADDDGNG